jgi:hypothetical protein
MLHYLSTSIRRVSKKTQVVFGLAIKFKNSRIENPGIWQNAALKWSRILDDAQANGRQPCRFLRFQAQQALNPSFGAKFRRNQIFLGAAIPVGSW